MPRYTNTFSAQTPYGQGLNNIASAMMAGPSRYEVEHMQAQTEAQRLENERAKRALAANSSISDVIGQAQMLGGQTAGFVPPESDQGLQTVVGGVPVAAAKYGAEAGGLTPDMSRTIYAAMSQYAPEDTLRRMLPVLGHVPGANTALTSDRADQVRKMQTDEAIRAGYAKPMTVYDQASPTKGRISTVGDAIAQAMYALPKGYYGGGSHTPLDVSPTDDANLESLLNSMAGVRYDKKGNWVQGSNPPLAPEAMRTLLDRTASYYQQTRNARHAAELAWKELTGGAPLSVTGTEDTAPWIPFVGEDTRQQTLPPAASPTTVDGGPPAGAIDYLRANPGLAAEFDAKYGHGAAAKYLGNQ